MPLQLQLAKIQHGRSTGDKAEAKLDLLHSPASPAPLVSFWHSRVSEQSPLITRAPPVHLVSASNASSL